MASCCIPVVITTNGTANEVLLNAISKAKEVLESNFTDLGKMCLLDDASEDTKQKKQQILGLQQLLKDLEAIVAVNFVK